MAYDRNFEDTAALTDSGDGSKYHPHQIRKRYNLSKTYRNGKLVLTPQACLMEHQTSTMHSKRSNSGTQTVPLGLGSGLISYPYTPPHSTSGPLADRLQNRARARFMGRVQGETASMGITLATWKQSRDMILDRTRKLSGLMDVEEKNLRTRSAAHAAARWSKDKGNLYLEGLFGWMPLITDISSAIAVVSSHPLPSTYIRGSATETFENESVYLNRGSSGNLTGWSWDRVTKVSGSRRTTITARVDVSNPNLWLANRLGILNAPAVAVDLVPWSWVVGMFWNQSQFVSQLTDTVGLSFHDMSITHTSRSTTSSTVTGTGWFMTGAYAHGTQSLRVKTRSLATSLPPIRPMVRVPEASWGLAATALALLAQRSERLLQSALKIRKQIRSVDLSRYTD